MKKPTIPRKVRKELVKAEHIPRTTFSFYRYVRLTEPKAVRDELFTQLSSLGCMGRIYVASEGINAQMNVPTENFEKFDTYLQSKKEFNSIDEYYSKNIHSYDEYEYEYE